MRKRDDAEVEIIRADAHRVADLDAIGQDLFAAKTDRARRSGRARGKLEEGRRVSLPVTWFVWQRANRDLRCSCRRLGGRIVGRAARDGGTYNRSPVANLQSSIALALRHAPLKRQRDETFCQTSEQQRRPRRLIADLDRNDITFSKSIEQAGLKSACFVLDPGE